MTENRQIAMVSKHGRIPKKRVISINFEGPLGVQNLFCGRLECKIYFAAAWSAKFILLSAKIDNDPFFGNAPNAHYKYHSDDKANNNWLNWLK